MIQAGLLELIRKNRMTIEILKASKEGKFWLANAVRKEDYPYALKAIQALKELGFVDFKNGLVKVKDYRKLREFFKSKEYMMVFAEITIKRTIKNCMVERDGKKLYAISQWGELCFSIDGSEGIKLMHPQKVKALLKQNRPIEGLNILYLKMFLEYFTGKTEKVHPAIEHLLVYK